MKKKLSVALCVALILCAVFAPTFALRAFAAQPDTYTLGNLGGRQTTFYVFGTSTGTEQSVEYAVGELPLTFQATVDYGTSNTSTNLYAGGFYIYTDIKAGDYVDLTFYCPQFATTLVTNYTISNTLKFNGTNSVASAGRNKDGELTSYNGTTGILAKDPAFSDDFTVEPITASGSLVGFHVTGTAIDDVDELYYSHTVLYDKGHGAAIGTVTYTFNSVNDLQLYVTRADAGGETEPEDPAASIPSPPDWDATTYYYAFMVENTETGAYEFHAYTKQLVASSDGTASFLGFAMGVKYEYNMLQVDPWGEPINAGVDALELVEVAAPWQVVWSNYDILYEDGTLFFPATRRLPNQLSQTVTQEMMTGVLTEVVTILPIGLACGITYLALRKGLAILRQVLLMA